MLAFVVLLVAAATRLIPHAMHGIGLNFTAVGAGLLFFGSRRPRWQAIIAAAVMALTDIYITTRVYNMRFHVTHYLVTWAWYAGVCLIGAGLLRKVTALRVLAGVLASATSFFLVSNFMVWSQGHMYPHTLSGLTTCYALAVPFYGNDLASTGLVATALFGLPVLATYLSGLFQAAQDSQHPLA